jgi:uncharacterized radical SAM superfamily Fe-S cluster-containing enzyme
LSTQTFSPAPPAQGAGSPKPTAGAFVATKRPEFKIVQPEITHTGSLIKALPTGLPKTTESLCPECTKLIPALIFEENGKAVMEKTCPEHGYFKDTISSDVHLYLKIEQWHFGDGRGVTNPAIEKATRCPDECGLCSIHHSHTVLANVDLTNRCNLTCPVCFANANVQGYLYEPDINTVRKMLQALRDEKPASGRVVQFSGGEPTIHPNFFEICAMARDMGFSHVQAATNGIMMSDLAFAQEAAKNGLNNIYLQFDGISDDIYRRVRGEALLDKKLKAIENCRQVGIKICFVPTIVKGVNDHQVGDIVKTALKNIDVVSSISFQPVAFTGRINRNELEEKRYTLADLAHAVSDQTGLTDKYHDWFPLSFVSPFSKLLEALRGEGVPTLTCHPQCGLGTYLFVSKETGEAVPVTRFIDVGGMMQDMEELARKTAKSRFKFLKKLTVLDSLRRHYRQEHAPSGMSFPKFLQTLQGLIDKKYGRDKNHPGNTYHTLLVAGMHFMDSYNYDIERVKRCVIHYAAPNGLLYPFCAYNAGPDFRSKIEKKYSVPLEKPLHATKGCAPAVSCGGCGQAD